VHKTHKKLTKMRIKINFFANVAELFGQPNISRKANGFDGVPIENCLL
jgi:hypothetical protein